MTLTPELEKISPAKLNQIIAQARNEHWSELVLLGPAIQLGNSAKWPRELKSAKRIFQLRQKCDDVVGKITDLTNLTTLNLSYNNIGDDGASALATLNNLTSLTLNSNKIGDDGASALATLNNLTSLTLSFNNIGDDGASALATLNNLTSLTLSFNKIGDDGASALATLNNLTSLTLNSNKIGADGASALATLNNLTSLTLDSNKIGDDGASALATLNNLTSLTLSFNNIGDDGASALATLNNLTSLTLSFNKIGDDGASALATLNNLTSLTLNSNNIGDDGASALATLNNLTSLNLNSNKIGDDGASALATLNNLTSLTLNSNNIGDDGASALATLNNLTSLTLNSNKIGADGASALATLNNLTSLYLSYNNIGADGASALATLNNLTSLTLNSNNIGDDGASALATLNNLTSLTLNSNKIGADGASALATLNNLTSLTLDSNKIGADGASALATLNNLTSLTLNSNNIGDDGASALAALNNLTSLTLSFNNIGDDGASALATLNNLTSLTLDSNKIGDDGASALATLNNLTSLTLSFNNIGDDGASALATLNNLTSLTLNSNKIGDDGASALATLNNLTSLTLNSNKIGDDGASALATLNNLTSLNLSYNKIGDKGARALASLANLTSLYLYDCSTDIPPELLGRHEVDNCLKTIRTHFLDLDAGEFEDKELKLILLGNGRVGKTSLSKRFFHNTFDPEEDSTHGIRLDICSHFALSDGETCCLNIWDFGGQDIYHGTHSLFLKSRAIFIVVWDDETEKTPIHEEDGLIFNNYPLNYWCDYIRSVSPHSPVIVVQNKCDEKENDKLAPSNIGLWPHIHFSAQEGRGKAHLEGCLKEACEQLLKGNQYTIGIGRAAIKQQIRKYQTEDESRNNKEKKHQLMSSHDFAMLCKKENEQGNRISSANALLSYLHHTGVLYYEQNIFNDQIILDQRWAIDAIYTIYHREKVLRRLRQGKGRFTRQDLNDLVWEENGYNQKEQHLFLSFMESCDICFSINQSHHSEQQTEYLAPDMLPELAEVNNEVERYRRLSREQPSISIQFIYKFLHRDIQRRLMAFVGREYWNDVVYWDNGFILEDASRNTTGEALFEYRIDDAYPARGRITVETCGPNQEPLLKQLIKHIVEFHKDDDVETMLASIDRSRHWIDVAKIDDAIKTGSIVSECGERLEIAPFRFIPHLFDDKEISQTKRSEESKVTGKKPVYISYAWGDDTPEGIKRQAIVERLHQSLEAAEYDVRRDIINIQYRDEITEFMEEIRDAPCVVAIVSNKYLRSEACMNELVSRWIKGQDFVERTAPIVLDGTGLHDLTMRISHVQYWSDKSNEVKEALGKIPRENLATNAGVQVQYDRLRRIAQGADEVMGKLANMNTFTMEKLEENDFALVKSAIEASLSQQ